MKSYKERIAALEALEAAQDAAGAWYERMWADVYAGVEQRRIDWRPNITTAQIDILADALADGRLVLNLRDDHMPTWYDFCPPTPYTDDCWKTPHYRAGKAIAEMLGDYQRTFFDGWRGPMPTESAAVIQWLRECKEWYATEYKDAP